ncbi:MAG: ribosome maturation factor RimM [Gemmatimonadaceae bacterium]|nr:ribosome maturation factor RimM [Gloeobacterales cyanobacterium ES-bin-141]
MWLEVGLIVAAQGLRGELRVKPLTDFPERLTSEGKRLGRSATGDEQTLTLLGGRVQPGKDLYICRVEGVTDRTSAEALVGWTLLVPADERPRLSEGEFWLPDLITARVFRQDTGEQVGVVKDVIRAGNDLLVVGLSGSGKEVLVPFVPELVPEVDVSQGRVVVNPIPGLLNPEQAESE